MFRTGPLLAVVLSVFWPWASLLAQSATEFSTLRFTHAFELERERMLLELREGATNEFLTAARELVSLADGAGSRKTVLLSELQYLSDSIAILEQDVREAAAAVGQARDGLIRALETRVALETDETRRRVLQAEIDELRDMDSSIAAESVIPSDVSTLDALAVVVADERTRLRTLNRLQDELRLFLGNLRLFDETGMPPSVRADAGSGTDPGAGCGCGIPGTAALASPGDLPLEHIHSGTVSDDRLEAAASMSVASLNRLEEHLTRFGAGAEEIGTLRDDTDDEFVTRDLTIKASVMTYRDDAGGLTGMRLEAASSLLLPFALGRGLQLAIEPRMGGRSVQLDPGSSTEVAGEVWESLSGTARKGRLRLQVSSWQKGRYLSEPLPLPAYQEPGRKELGLLSRAALALRPGWDMEFGGGGDLVRYGPDEWQVLDREGVNAYGAVARQGTSSFGKLSFTVSHSWFSAVTNLRRTDTRLGVVVDWGLEGQVVLRLSLGGAWNESRLSAYDYLSARAAAVLSAPLKSSLLQLYGALTYRSYLNPGIEDARVAPSDQDTGSVVAFQLSHPFVARHSLALRAEWSRSETGFQNDFYQRFAVSALVSMRGLGQF